MKMKRLSIIAMMMTALVASAQTVSVDEAMSKARKFLSSNTQRHLKFAANKSLDLAYTAVEKATDEPLYYVFNNGQENGFIIISGEEKTEEVLAYSTDGTFNIEAINPNFKYWLGEYERQIEFIRSNPAANEVVKNATAKQDVPVLVATRWDQEEPYFNIIYKETGQKYLTGCVATAMSQVLKTHEWPVRGTGSHTYTDYEYSGHTFSVDFSEHEYDWSHMKNEYQGMYTAKTNTTEVLAVAQLMYDAGVSVEMEYGTASDGGSGAYTEFVPYALVNYFGYDKAVKHQYRDYYSDEEWAELLYNELAAGHPVIYGGCDNDGGHCFICDGYDASTNKYHFNWGWSGSGDCYSALSLIKGGGYTWKYYQDAVTGIQKPVESSKAESNIILYDNCSLHYTTSERNGKTTYSVNFGTYKEEGVTYTGFIYNDAWSDFDVYFTMKYTNQTTGDVYYATYPAGVTPIKMSFFSSYANYEYDGAYVKLSIKDVIAPKLPAGTYHVSLAYKEYKDMDSDSVAWKDVRSFTSCKNYEVLTIESNVPAPTAENTVTADNSSFIAKWSAVEGATSYDLEVTQKEKNASITTLLQEDFAGVSGDGSTDISNSLDTYLKDKGWTGTKIFASSNSIKCGSNSSSFSLTTPAINAKGELTLTFKYRGYGSDGPVPMKISLKDSTGKELENTEVSTEDDGNELTVNFTKAVEGCRITIASTKAKKRMYFDSIELVGGGTASTVTKYTGITGTEYTVTDADLEKYEYSYRVMATTEEGNSKWSNVATVEYSDAPQTLLGDANCDKEVNVGDYTTIANYILDPASCEVFDRKAADANEDGNIDVGDLTTVANIILTGEAASAKKK